MARVEVEWSQEEGEWAGGREGSWTDEWWVSTVGFLPARQQLTFLAAGLN